MPEPRLFDTLSREIRPLAPLDGRVFRIYCCGPTVYGPAHIGNFRTFVVQDVLRRVVEAGGVPTLHVRNITDVDDKTIRDSQAAGMKLAEFTDLWARKFHADCAALNLLPPHVEPGAVAHIPQQIRMIEILIERGHAYAAADGSVYFKVASFPAYGRLSHLEDRELRLGAASSGEANSADEYGKDTLADFALWKARKPEDGENHWPSPWGPGRPGWHLECSAMIQEYLGSDFDLHSGGVDLVFPHHENEIAQSCCATGGGFARHWFHITHLMVDGGKMSKSLGNLHTLEDLAAKGFTAAEVRYTLIGAHYRQPLNFTMNSLEAARSALQRLAKSAAALHTAAAGASIAPQGPGPFAAAWEMLNDDLNVPGALGSLFGALNSLKPAAMAPNDAAAALGGLHFLLDALGLVLPDLPEATVEEAPESVRELAERRWQAKQARDWAAADALRFEIEAAGWLVKDSKTEYQLVRKA
jgi:cysteinyl-tRNA synthetase